MAPGDVGRRVLLVKSMMLFLIVGNVTLFLSHSDDVFTAQSDGMVGRLLSINAAIGYSVDRSDGEEMAFSSCLLVPESEIERLPEWIAYHYYTMPLQHLVVLPDPSAEGAASKVLQKYTSMITIEQWTNAKLMDSASNVTSIVAQLENEDLASFRDRRAAAFYYRCAIHMQERQQQPQYKEKRQLVSFHQVNEFAAINPDSVTNAANLMEQYGSIARLIQSAHAHKLLPHAGSCVTTYSAVFSSECSSSENNSQHATDIPDDIPDDLQQLLRHFDTTHEQCRAPKSKLSIGNAFLAVSDIPNLAELRASQKGGTFRGRFEFSPHCPPTRPMPVALVRMHVYLEKKDSLINEQQLDRSKPLPWFQGFVAKVGFEPAQSLLSKEGLVTPPVTLEQ